MELPAASSSKNFSSIARRLLLNRSSEQSSHSSTVLLGQDILENKPPDEEPVMILPQDFPDNKPPVDDPSTFECEDITDYEPPVEQAVALLQQDAHNVRPVVTRNVLLLPVAGYRAPPIAPRIFRPPCKTGNLSKAVQPLPEDFRIPEPVADLLCERVRGLTVEKLMAPLGGSYIFFRGKNANGEDGQSLGRRAKIVIRRVRQFFEELKKLLGDTSDGTIFNSAVQMTAMACGVSPTTVTKIGVRPDFVHELFPRKKKKVITDEETAQEGTLRKYGEEWGKVVRYFIKEKLKKDRMTIAALHDELTKAYADFPMSRNTLYRFTKALGVTYGRKRGIAYMLL
ncbi:hypothetical protein RB195_012356 [Necator americanus]